MKNIYFYMFCLLIVILIINNKKQKKEKKEKNINNITEGGEKSKYTDEQLKMCDEIGGGASAGDICCGCSCCFLCCGLIYMMVYGDSRKFGECARCFTQV